MGDSGGEEAMEVGEGAPPSPSEEYSQLRDLRLSFDLSGHEDGFRVCFWLYMSPCSQFPASILHKIGPDGHSGVPFLVLSRDTRITLYPLCCLQEELSSSSPLGNSPQSMGTVSISAELSSSFLRWIHIGFQVSRTRACLYVDGNLAEEMELAFLDDIDTTISSLGILSLVGNNGLEGTLHGCIHDIQHLPKSISNADHLLKNPPIQLSLDPSCSSDGIEDCTNSIWSIVGGKASCRMNFTVEVILLDVFSRLVHKEMEIFASLIYDDNGAPVEKAENDSEAPLLINCDGIDFPSADKPIKVIHGRATFRLKISQLSSKCDNRLFRVLFQSVDTPRYSFIHAYSPPIRCISRNPGDRTPDTLGIKPSSNLQHLGGSYSQGQYYYDKHKPCDLQMPDQTLSKPADSSKHAEMVSQMNIHTHGIFQPRSNGCFTHPLQADVGNNNETDSEENFQDSGEMDEDLASDSESADARNASYNRSEDNLLSDETVFRYCLEGTNERYMLLKEIGQSAADQDIQKFAEQVSLYSGCSHHLCQILMSKQLVQEGISSWHAIARGNSYAHWIDSLPEIIRRFRKISRSSRALSRQDIEVLHKIAGCDDDMNRGNFNKLWSWLYPIARTISMEQINDMWESTSPKWIEGLITKEEAENALKFPGGGNEPGTFVLRFPTSRSWPHPDAGSLVVTFIGADHIIHNKLLKVDARNIDPTPLAELLLEEPGLRKLARVPRFL